MLDLLTIPPVLGFFGTGYALHLLWQRWQNRRAKRTFLRWCVNDPTTIELDDIMQDPEHAAILLRHFRDFVLHEDHHTGEKR